MKIAHVMRRFNLNRWGGTESVVWNISKQLNAREIPSIIFCTDMFCQCGEQVVDGVTVRRHRFVFPWFGLSQDSKHKMELKGGSPLSLCMFWALLREPNLSLIHTHVQHRLGGIARTVARLRGIPYVVSIHGGYLTMPEDHSAKMQEPFKNKWEWGKLFGWFFGARKTLDDANAIVCVGKDEYEAMQKKYPNKPIFYVPNGVNREIFQSADASLFRNKFGIDETEKIILCVSRIDFQKNQVLLVRAFASFVERHPSYKLVLIGPINVEDYHKEILATAKELGVEDHLLIVPGFSPEDPLLPSAYRAASMFVLPSRMEPFGIVILEAWAAGIPVIASNVGGIPGFTTQGKDVLLYENGNQEQLVDCMERIAQDPFLSHQLVLGGAEAVRSYSWESVADQILQIYQREI